MTVTIRYNVPIGSYRAVEKTETFRAVSMWKADGTSLVYFRTNKYNVRAVAASEIISIK